MNKEGLEDLASKMTDRVVELEAQVLALQTQLEQLKGHSTAVPSEHGARSTASGTPRTDEATRLMQFADAEEQYEVVTSYFARQLETENAALRAQLERVERETKEKCIAECCVLEIERVNSLGHTVMRARFPREIIAAVQALPAEQQKG